MRIDQIAQDNSSVLAWRLRFAALEARAHLALLKMRIVVPLTVVAAVSAIVAGHGTIPLDKIIILILSGGLASAGAASLNHYLDRDIDAVMERTKRRPIPSGEIRNPTTAALFGLGLVAGAVALASSLNYLSLAFIALGAFFYVVVYTFWLKRSSPLNVVIGGFAGSCAALAGWSAVDPNISLAPILVGLLVFLWTPSHFWSLAIVLKEQYRQAGVPMLPVLIGERRTAFIVLANTAITLLVSTLPFYFGFFHLTYLVVAVAAGVLAIRANIRMLLDPSQKIAWQNYKFSGMYLGLLFVGMLFDAVV